VISAVDPRTLFVGWLDGVRAAARLHDRWARRPQADGYESKLDIAAARNARVGLVSDPPMFLVNTPSVLDASMRPGPGSHLPSLEVLWTPYSLRGGWHGSAQPFGWLERLATLAGPGLLDGVRDWRVMTPPDYEREFSMARGFAPSFPGGVVGSLLGRQRELSRYRTSVDGLFLTGAGTFPGAGVWGASGRNAAAAVLRAD
jgi:phytoene dehydrogenase-like protein